MHEPVAFVYEGFEPYIFVSYSHQDSNIVMPLIRGMQRHGFRIWYDAGIEHGNLWQENIANRLEHCSCMLILLSRSAVESHHCRNEIVYGADRRKPMLVVYLDDCILTPGLQLLLGSIQAINRNIFSNDSLLLESLCKEKMLINCIDRNAQKVEQDLYEVNVTIEALGTALDRISQKPMLLNLNRLQEFSEAYHLLEKAAEECGALLTYHLHEPYQFCGAISICGEDLVFTNSADLSKAILLASNVEIYPKTDGTIQMNFSFNNLASPIAD